MSTEEIMRAISEAAKAKAMPTGKHDLPALATPPPTPATPQIITRADIDRAVAQHRAEKAGAQQTLDF